MASGRAARPGRSAPAWHPCGPGEEVDEDTVGPSCLRVREPGNRVAEVTAVELCVLVDGAGEEALAQRAERDEADAEFLEHGNDRLFGLPPPQRVFALQCGDRLHRVRVADGLRAGLREAEVPDLPPLDQLLDRAGHLLDRDVAVDTVLVEQVDVVGTQPFQRLVDGAADRFGPAVQTPRLPGGQLEAELGRDDDLIPDARPSRDRLT